MTTENSEMFVSTEIALKHYFSNRITRKNRGMKKKFPLTMSIKIRHVSSSENKLWKRKKLKDCFDF